MKTRLFSALLALALPLCAQDVSVDADAVFYKAFYLEKGARDFAGAMDLYSKFLAAAPESKLAKVAAKQQFGLLNRTGKTKERDAFREKYAKLLGSTADRGGRPATGEAPAGDRREGGRRGGRGDRGDRGEGGEGGRGDRGDRGDRGEGGQRGGRGGRRGGIFGSKKLVDMDKEELASFKEGLDRMEGMIDRMRERMGEERTKAFADGLAATKKALEAGKLDEAQKAVDKVRESMGRGRRGGGGGGN